MSNSEYADRHERKHKPTEAEMRQNENADRCYKVLKGQLSPTDPEWIEKWRKEK
jgi:hydrogenase maturation factor